MAVRACIATGNWTTAGTWGVVDATSYLNVESATESLLTTAYSGTVSTAFTPGAITVSHIGVKLCERIGTTGTVSVKLILDIGDTDVAGTEVTIDTADLPSALEAELNGGWVFFKLATPVLLLAATAYQLTAKTSTATMVDLFCDGTVDNLSRALITTTTGAPSAGDEMIVAGEYTGQGTSNAFVVTMNETAATDYGTAPTALLSLVNPGIAVCSKGTLRCGVAAATAYVLKVSSSIVIYSGGELDLGTVATPIPRGSSMTLTFDCGANIDYGLNVRALGTFIAQGLSRTSGKVIDRCLLNTDEAAAQTVLGVDTDTGWLDTDEIVIASTSRTASQTELRVLSGNAGAADMTVTVGLTNAHSGTTPTQAEVVLLTRNVLIQGSSATLQSYVYVLSTAIVECDWTAFKWMGSATAGRRGIDLITTTGSAAFSYCCMRDFLVTNSTGVFVAGTSSDNYTVQDCVFYDINANAFINVATSGTAWIFDNCIDIGHISTASSPFSLLDAGGTFTNNTVAGSASTGPGITINEPGATIGTISGLTAHSTAGASFNFVGLLNGQIDDVVAWRSSVTGLNISNLGNITIDGLTLFGNGTSNLVLTGGFENVIIKDGSISSDTTFSTLTGIAPVLGSGGEIRFENCVLGAVAGITADHTRDILAIIGGFVNFTFHNCLLASGTPIGSQTVMPPGVKYKFQKYDQTDGSHRTHVREGTITLDTTISNTASPSERLAPALASEMLESGHKQIAVADTGTVTVTVYTRRSSAGDGTAYNGSQPRLILKRNAAAGIAADVVLDTHTAADGSWEQLTGTTAAVTDDAVLEFCVDCDGTLGWVNVDDWATS